MKASRNESVAQRPVMPGPDPNAPRFEGGRLINLKDRIKDEDRKLGPPPPQFTVKPPPPQYTEYII